MVYEIGMTAGKVYRYLASNGPALNTKLKKDLGVDSSLVDQAIGWLARENKLDIESLEGDSRIRLRPE